MSVMTSPSGATDAPILIIGAGQAGAMAASALRGMGYEGALTIVGEEDFAPYERPPLSKAVLLEPEQDNAIHIHPQALYGEKAIELRVGAQVAKLDTAAHVAMLADGNRIHYSKALIATGGRVRELPAFPVGSSQRVHYIRTLKDAKALRAQLNALAASDAATRQPLVVLGGGFLGLEVASTAKRMGLQTIVLEAANGLLTRATPPAFSDWLATVVRAQGVDLRLGIACKNISETAEGMALTLSDGSTLNAGMLVAAIGQIANTELACAAQLQVCAQTGGIVIDAQCATSAPDVFAAGDCTTQFQPLLGKAVRLESWQSANEQARIAAAAMLGVATEPAATPWFWTDMFDLNVQMMGLPQPDLSYVVRGEMPQSAASVDGGAAPKFLIFGLDAEQRLRFVLAVNSGGDLRALRPLFAGDIACNAADLIDTTKTLRDTAKRLQASAKA